ncbi:MAG TPA: hypothetical protein VM536_06015 [Chloroflexia bacterium]|nr:hypothetical protein [Chloroflexia bacterium]
MSRLRWILALALVAGALAATVQPAAAQTGFPAFKQPSSAHFDIAGIISIFGSDVAFRGGGSLSGADAETSITIAGAAGSTPVTVQLIQVGGKTYLNSGSGWQVMDTAQAAGQMTPGLPGMNTMSPADALRLINAASNVRSLGPATVGNTATTQYQADIDVAKLLSMMGPADPSTEAVLKNAGMSLFLWIGDADQYLHQERIVLTLKMPADPAAGTPELNLSEDLTITFRDFDTAITITAPPNATPITPGGSVLPPIPSPGGAGTSAPPSMPSEGLGPGMPRTGGSGGSGDSGPLAAFGLALACLLAGIGLRRTARANQ